MEELLEFHGARWLLEQRKNFVSCDGSASSRVSLTSGRTGTRLNIGKPQLRWDAGVSLASAALGSRSESHSSRHVLSIGSRIREAALIVSRFFAGSNAPDLMSCIIISEVCLGELSLIV